jgi:hypothetical protein
VIDELLGLGGVLQGVQIHLPDSSDTVSPPVAETRLSSQAERSTTVTWTTVEPKTDVGMDNCSQQEE